jgi:O-methyltransferase
MRQFVRRIIWRILGNPPPTGVIRGIDAMGPRWQALDMAIVNIAVSTRLERCGKPTIPGGPLLGDYAEFGVYRGDTFAHVFRRARDLMPPMRFFAFDSFEGLPQLKGIDQEGEFWQGQFACSQQDFEANLKQKGVDMSRVRIVPGWFDRTLTDASKEEHSLRVVSIAYIDCDVYESCVSVLSFLTDLVRQGSILLFDDWFNYRNRATHGVQRVTTEWLAANKRITLTEWCTFLPFGKAFIVNVSR